MESVGIITFHAAHNYGSMLQAFALQHILEKENKKVEIINFRSPVQKKLYSLSFAVVAKGWKRYIDKLFIMFYSGDLQNKYRKFEQFLNDELFLSACEYESIQQLADNMPDYDVYLAGSDQIWNIDCIDFSWAYFLPFPLKGKKIAYAPSMGNVQLNDDVKNVIISYLNDFDAISVRERSAKLELQAQCCKPIEVVLDPTLLLSGRQWLDYVGVRDYDSHMRADEIFLYTPFPNRKDYALAEQISRRLKMKVCVSLYNTEMLLRYPRFRLQLNSGPWDFLNMVNTAGFVCCASYHALIFSLLFHVPFVVLNKQQDSRIKTLLHLLNLEDLVVTADCVEKGLTKAFEIDFGMVDEILEVKRKQSMNFLQHALLK